MLYTNINISDNSNRLFKYVIGYEVGSVSHNLSPSYIRERIGNVDLVHMKYDGTTLVRMEDYWELSEMREGWSALSTINCKTSKLYVYFPRFSVETYNPDKEVKYALTVNTWVDGERIVLGSYLISRSNALAVPPQKLFGDEYIECAVVDMIDVYEFLYSSIWNSNKDIMGVVPNNHSAPCSLLNISLYPVVNGDVPGTYLMMDGYVGSQNSIRIDDGKNINFLNASIKLVNTSTGVVVRYSIIDNYDGGISPKWLEQFIRDTYNYYIADGSIRIEYSIALRNEDDIFNVFIKELASDIPTASPLYVNDLKFDGNGINWAWWENYTTTINKTLNKPLVLQGVVTIGGNDENGNYREMFYMRTNEIPVTQEVFSYFLPTNGRRINLNNINMNLLNISTANKTEHVVYKYDNVNDAKSNIIQPVFFKARDLGNIIIHPEVTENICINLDQFKSKVKRFIIQIEGCMFHEIGRTGSGVVFKITGNILPKEKTSGLYYILDENSVLVTNGNYNYVM